MKCVLAKRGERIKNCPIREHKKIHTALPLFSDGGVSGRRDAILSELSQVFDLSLMIALWS